MIRTYSELRSYKTLEERYAYLRLKGNVGDSTFGFDRWINQKFYKSKQWQDVRDYVIVRDEGCDLGILGNEIFSRLAIHHMNPMTVEQITNGAEEILDPNFLITVSHSTHNAIHYGVERLTKLPLERSVGDTQLW